MPGALQQMIVYYPGLDNVDNRTTVFRSTTVESEIPFVARPDEVVEIAWVPRRTCIDMVLDGKILDAMSVAGMLTLGLAATGNGSHLSRD